MKRFLFLSFFIITIIFSLSSCESEKSSASNTIHNAPADNAAKSTENISASAAEENITVYVTRTGTKYHTENCTSLRSTKIAISLSKAIASYEPCSICHSLSSKNTASNTASVQTGLYQVNKANIKITADADTTLMLNAVVSGHVDGDTVKLKFSSPPEGIGAAETVRLLGVDTPETVHPNRPVEKFGKEASNFTKTSLLGKQVYIAFDWDLRDRYGRLLVYIYTAPGECFNAELIRQGYGHAYTSFAFQFKDEFKALEAQAREAKKGLWGEE